MKEKCVRAYNAPFMNKALSKAIMTRSRLRNKFLRNHVKTNKMKYNKQCNYCVNLLRKEKKKYLDLKNITDNKQFWKTMKPLFTDNHKNNRKITLIDRVKIISNETEVSEIMNDFFSNAVSKLDIKGYKVGVSKGVTKFIIL